MNYAHTWDLKNNPFLSWLLLDGVLILRKGKSKNSDGYTNKVSINGGQFTVRIPHAIAEAIGLKAGSHIEFYEARGDFCLRKAF